MIHYVSDEQKIEALWSLTRSTPLFVYDVTNLKFITMLYGYKNLSEYLKVHPNTAKRIAKSHSVFNDKFIVSLEEVKEDTLKEIISKSSQLKTTKVRAIYVYDADLTTLLHVYKIVNAFMKASCLNGSDVKTFSSSENRLWLNTYFITYELISEADNYFTNVKEFVPQKRGKKISIPVYRYNSDGSKLIEVHPSLRHLVKTLHGSRDYNTKSLKLRILHKETYEGFRVSYSPLNTISEVQYNRQSSTYNNEDLETKQI
jgi:hypothetical protein